MHINAKKSKKYFRKLNPAIYKEDDISGEEVGFIPGL